MSICKYPPAEPEALRLLAPQRGLIATDQSQKQQPSTAVARYPMPLRLGKAHPRIVKLLLPPRQSRGVPPRPVIFNLQVIVVARQVKNPFCLHQSGRESLPAFWSLSDFHSFLRQALPSLRPLFQSINPPERLTELRSGRKDPSPSLRLQAKPKAKSVHQPCQPPSPDFAGEMRTNVSISPSGSRTSQNSSKSAASPRVTCAPARLNINRPSSRLTRKAVGKSSSTCPDAQIVVNRPVAPLSLTVQLGLNWLKNNAESSSVEERMFVLIFMDYGLSKAADLAAKFHWKCQRPLRELRGRNYSARSAKRKPLSGSPASSRKR